VTSAEPLRVTVCHCLACQQRTGSVFGAQARFRADAVTLGGLSTQFVRIGDEGGRATFHFCATCGSTVYYTFEGHEEFIGIPVGAFADPTFPAPKLSIYEERQHAWVRMPEGIEHLE
jgi:hypothetical protein